MAKAIPKRKRNDDDTGDSDKESRHPKKARTDPFSMIDHKDPGTHTGLRVSSAPWFVVPQFGASYFDPNTISVPWDMMYKLILLPLTD